MGGWHLIGLSKYLLCYLSTCLLYLGLHRGHKNMNLFISKEGVVSPCACT